MNGSLQSPVLADDIGDVVVLFRPPSAAALTLPSAPRLESWNAAEHRDQQRLRGYLAEAEALIRPMTSVDSDHLALELVVGLPGRITLTRGGHDLDNYLLPLVRHLGPTRFDAVFATKRHASTSTIAVGPAVPFAMSPPEPLLRTRTTASSQLLAWKQQVYAACSNAVTGRTGDGPIAVTIRFGVSSRRNWASLWKPAIDALGPLLGMPDPTKPFHPNDDRIVRLGMHRTVNDELSNDVELDIWWHLLPA